MKKTKLTFQQIVERLEAAKIPCNVKRFGYNDNINYAIEFGFNWPEELVEAVDKAFDTYGDKVPDYVNLCGSIVSDNMTANKKIAGGPKMYYGYNKW